MNTVLVCCDYYLPGYKAGGPITTLSSLATAIQDQCRVFILTTDRDYLDSRPYFGVDRNVWNDRGGYMVRYLDLKAISISSMAKIISDINPDTVYLNSVFSYQFSIRPLLARRLGKVNVSRWVLCPRGELNKGALQKNLIRKMLFLIAAKLTGLHKGVVWQGTNHHECSRVYKIIGGSTEIVHVQNLARFVDDDGVPRLMRKQSGYLKIIFAARINPHKNLMLLLDALSCLDADIELTIFGPVDDRVYWKRCTEKIIRLPHNIRVIYAGVHDRQVVVEAMRQAHVLVLPSRGENFGQVIFESLSVGTPVIISDQTPWKGLSDEGVGFDCSIDSSEPIIRALSEMVVMDEAHWLAMVSNAKAYARASIMHNQIANEMLELLFVK